MLMCDGLVNASGTMSSFAGRSSFSDAAGETLATAYDLGAVSEQRTLDGRVGGWDSADIFRFELAADSTIDLALADRYRTTNFQLLNERGARVSTVGDQVEVDLDAGTYFVQVVASRFYTRYQLTIEATGQPAANESPIQAPDSTTEAPPPTSQPSSPTPLTDVGYFGGTNDWNVNSIGAPESWSRGYTGSEITVAVIDTGVDTRHADLNDNLWFNIDEIAGDGIDNDGNGFVDDTFGWNFVENNANVYDTQGHGTHVAGTIAAERNGFGATGVAYDANIMSIRVLGDNGSGSTSDIAAGIRYAVDNGADIVNLSLGGGYSPAIQSALQYANTNDVFVAVASGNSGRSQASYPALHSSSLDNVISVGAHDSNGRSASFSNDAGSAVQVDAPGVSVYSTLPNNRYARFSGTSMAAPHVAGLAALALSANPTLSASELRDVVVSGANREVTASDSSGIDATYSVAYAAANYVGSGQAANTRQIVSRGSTRLRATSSAATFVTPSTEPSRPDRPSQVAQFSDEVVDAAHVVELPRLAYVVEPVAERGVTQGAQVDDALAETDEVAAEEEAWWV